MYLLSLSKICCFSHLHSLLLLLLLLSLLPLSRLSTALSMCHFFPIGCTHLSALLCNTLQHMRLLVSHSLCFSYRLCILLASPNGGFATSLSFKLSVALVAFKLSRCARLIWPKSLRLSVRGCACKSECLCDYLPASVCVLFIG